MVSGHPSALYDEMLSDWRRVALQVTTQAQVRTEVVWFNFTPERMHWASHAGRNATTVSASSARRPAGHKATRTCRRVNVSR